ncbi:hypothetical protein IMG5_190260 [Ichthyophthirius multifiliis]|uniref:Wntless-like transmembrane domain-containing protein n=1 Tax=Ichthyophthirius multifiliis TaxID=5932 RepID=G0R460_ICHMU|nr:hypothetical protein IMG5_190260 [Ichthyophthirius multifiliis]EGR27731.1 hypothetical protein IMG5_190260 [Ichthyophthirius multifiliis]|eukprot:XP_004025183.1 hypothetical protein IMG5_190260 [Ichthyophthirius multifiliis]
MDFFMLLMMREKFNKNQQILIKDNQVYIVNQMRRLAKNHWIIEQKLIIVLSGLLIMFNNPFYALIILEPHMAGSFFDILFLTNFLVLLLVFWMVILDRIQSENALKNSKVLTAKKIVFGLDPFVNFEDSFGLFYDFCKYFGIALMILHKKVIQKEDEIKEQEEFVQQQQNDDQQTTNLKLQSQNEQDNQQQDNDAQYDNLNKTDKNI